jgi:hypothetical protein
VIWLPREDQLRHLLGDAFLGLEPIAEPTPAFAVTVRGPDGPERHVDVAAEPAYARALLAVLTGEDR